MGGHEVEVTSRELSFSQVFLRHRGQVLSREQVVGHVWGHDVDPGSDVVDVCVRALRRTVGDGARCWVPPAVTSPP